MYINEIDPKIIEMVFSKEEITEYKEIAKLSYVIKESKYKLEQDVKKRLKNVVIGDLENIKLNYLAYGNTFYISYDSYNYKMNLLDRIKFLFSGKLN